MNTKMDKYYLTFQAVVSNNMVTILHFAFENEKYFIN